MLYNIRSDAVHMTFGRRWVETTAQREKQPNVFARLYVYTYACSHGTRILNYTSVSPSTSSTTGIVTYLVHNVVLIKAYCHNLARGHEGGLFVSRTV